jgi:hypothetical protein
LGDGQRLGHLDLEATEMTVRAAMHRVGGVLLGEILNADGGGHRGTEIDCGRGHRARFVDYRTKSLVTVLAPVSLRRAYYHCEQCGAGVIPKDVELDCSATSFSPGVRWMMSRVGTQMPFDSGRQQIEDLAGVMVTTKEVERVAEGIGEQLEGAASREREAVLSGKVVSIEAHTKLYIAMDGTGVPMVGRETAGRTAKEGNGQAKTREAKLGCAFTQTRLDEQRYPVRDEASTTYVGAIETAEEFGRRLYAEAARRGLSRAAQVIVLGDGAPWIWTLAGLYFPGALQIVDLYHAREHVADLGKVLYGQSTDPAKQWTAARTAELDTGDIDVMLRSFRRLRPANPFAQDELRRAVAYFETNAERMCYGFFRRQGLFVGSGVIEAGCKTIVGQRLKQSGMHWTIRGANAIIASRCCELSGRWEDFWEARSTG